MNDHIWMLVTRKLANEASEEELTELDNAVKQNPHFHNSLKLLFDWWDEGEQQQEEDSNRQFNKLLKRINATSAAQ